MATDSNYLTSLAGEMVPEVNKQIDADTKQFFTYIDGLYKNEEMRLKQGTGSVKANIDNFIAASKGIKQGVEAGKDIIDRERAWREWHITDEEAEKLGYMKTYDQDIANLEEADGNMTALGMHEMKKEDGNIDIGARMTQGSLLRHNQEERLQNLALDYNKTIARVAGTFKVPMGDGNSLTLDEASTSEERKHIMGAIRYAYFKQAGGVSRGQMRRHLFPQMRKTEQTLNAKWHQDKLLSTAEQAIHTETKRFTNDIQARGPEAVISYMQKNAKAWSGDPNNIDWSFVRSKAVDNIIAMVDDGSIPVAVAEQIFDHEFFAWDGSKQQIYNEEGKNKPYWPEFAKLAAAVDKKKREQIDEKYATHTANKKGFVLDMNAKAAEITDSGAPLTTEFRETIQEQWRDRFPGVQMPAEVARLMTTNEQDDDAQIKRLTHLYNQGTTITMPMLYGIDDQEKFRTTMNNLQVKRVGNIDQDDLKKLITAETNAYTEENDLNTAKTTKWYNIERNATNDYVRVYNNARASGQGHGEAETKAREHVQAQIKTGTYDKYKRTAYDKESHVAITKAREAILADNNAFRNSLLPGLEKDAETMYNYISRGQWGDPPVDAFAALAQRTKGLRGMNTVSLAVAQANQYAKENGLPLVKWNQSSTQKALNNEPAEVTSNLNSGNVVGGYSKTKDLPALLDTLVRPGSVDSGGADAILTDSGWRNSNEVYDKPISQHSIGEVLELDQAGYGSYGIPKHVLEEILPFSGLKETDLMTVENQQKLHLAKVFFNLHVMNGYQTLAQFDSNPMLSNWNAMNIEPGDVLELLEKVGPTDFNNKNLLLKALTK